MSALPLSHSSLLARVGQSAAVLAGLYAKGELHRTLEGARWRFRWAPVQGSFPGVELTVRIGPAQVRVGIEDFAVFNSAADVTRPEVPVSLRAAFLNGVGESLWQELERMARRAVRVVEVNPDRTVHVTPECLGFEIENVDSGAATRGILGSPVPASVQQILLDIGHREMQRELPTEDLPIHWAAVVGRTSLPHREAHALEAHDVIVIDDARYTALVLECSLCVGPERRYAGRICMQRGRMSLLEFSPKGNSPMSSPEAGASAGKETPLGDIPVTLRFELAQWQAPVKDVAALAPGSILDLGQPIDQNVVSVWIDQQCIGKGQLIVIGERLGVRLLSVYGQSGRPAAAPGPAADSATPAEPRPRAEAGVAPAEVARAEASAAPAETSSAPGAASDPGGRHPG